jgi:hypothetical protein
MSKEIILVSVTGYNGLDVNNTKAFEESKDAEEWHTKILNDFNVKNKEIIADYFEDGYCEIDTWHIEVTIIPYFEELF